MNGDVGDGRKGEYILLGRQCQLEQTCCFVVNGLNSGNETKSTWVAAPPHAARGTVNAYLARSTQIKCITVGSCTLGTP